MIEERFIHRCGEIIINDFVFIVMRSEETVISGKGQRKWIIQTDIYICKLTNKKQIVHWYHTSYKYVWVLYVNDLYLKLG